LKKTEKLREKVMFLPPGSRSRLTVTDEIASHIFDRVLEFLYSGFCAISGPADFVEETRKAADAFLCTELSTICTNVMEDNAFLNPSIGTYLNDQNGEKAKEIFLNKRVLSDIQFEVGSAILYGHRCIISARCPALKKRIEKTKGGSIRIKHFKLETFLSFLEYLYSSHTPINSLNQVDIMRCAAYYKVDRLVSLCELYISKEVERATALDIVKAEISIVELLHIAKECNAAQLQAFCLHFLCVNNQVYRKRSDWRDLSKEEDNYIDENQWPPKSYFQELEAYEEEMANRGKGKAKASECIIS